MGFSATIWKISSRNSLLIRLRPRPISWRERQRQYLRNPARCQCTTVSGVTIRREFFHSVHILLMPIQNNLSKAASFGRCLRRLKTETCWRRARFSSRRSLREQKQRQNRPTSSLNRRNMDQIYNKCPAHQFAAMLQNSKPDRILANDSNFSRNSNIFSAKSPVRATQLIGLLHS